MEQKLPLKAPHTVLASMLEEGASITKLSLRNKIKV